MLLALLVGCSDVRSVDGSIECVSTPGAEFVFSADVTMRRQHTAPMSVVVDVKLEETGELFITRALESDGAEWRTSLSMDELGTSCGAYSDDGLCYTFRATGSDRRTKEDVIGPEPCHEERTPTHRPSGGSGGGGGDDDDCYGTLVCNDGTRSCSCSSCTTGCCSGHGGCM